MDAESELIELVVNLRLVRMELFEQGINLIDEFSAWREHQQEILRDSGDFAWYKLKPTAVRDRDYLYFKWFYDEKQLESGVEKGKRRVFSKNIEKATALDFYDKTKLGFKSCNWEREEVWELELKLGGLRGPLSRTLKAVRELEKSINLIENPRSPKKKSNDR